MVVCLFARPSPRCTEDYNGILNYTYSRLAYLYCMVLRELLDAGRVTANTMNVFRSSDLLTIRNVLYLPHLIKRDNITFILLQPSIKKKNKKDLDAM